VINQAKAELLRRVDMLTTNQNELKSDSSHSIEDEYDEKVQQMTEMGLEREVALYCLAVVQNKSLERAMAFIYERDEGTGKLIHEPVLGLRD